MADAIVLERSIARKINACCEDHLYPLIESGEFNIDSSGQIWRCGIRYHGKLFSKRPKRAEKRMPHGYLLIRATVNGVTFATGAHRLVWRHFYGQIPRGLIVNHKDGVRSNNVPSNLELTDHAGNDFHARSCLGFDNAGERNGNAVLTDRLVRAIRSAAASGESLNSIARRTGFALSNIHRVIHRQIWKHVE